MTDSIDKSDAFLAVDLGASSGRVMVGLWDGERLAMEEAHRFPTLSARVDGRWSWGVEELFESVVEGMRRAIARHGERVVSVGVDTWAVDYALLGERGELLAAPVCYRDSRTQGMMEQLCQSVGKCRIYEETGIQFLFFNTLYQLAAERAQGRKVYGAARRLLFLSDLFNYWLSGRMATERSIASASQMLDPRSGDWSPLLLEAVGARREFMGEVIESGSDLGPVQESVARRIGSASLRVIAVPGHDTACAFMGLGADEPDFAILSSGTWSLMGLELEQPNCGQAAMEAGFSNEIGFGRSVRFLKNICGLWLVEECRRQWTAEGRELSFDEIASAAEQAAPLRSLIDPDNPRFARPGDMRERIAAYCRETEQPVPEGVGPLARCIFESLALKYRTVFRQLQGFAPRALRGLHVVGGGSRNRVLNSMTADATGLPVMAGPAEATALGNLAAQLIATGRLPDLAAARRMIARSFEVERVEPSHPEIYDTVENRWLALLERKAADTIAQ